MSAAQDAARARSWRIRNLRALYALCHQLTPANRAAAQAAVDAELVSIGANTQAQHAAKVAAEWEKRRGLEARADDFEDIPF